MMNKLAVFDFDSTLMDGETIDFLAAPLGLEEQVAAITERAMAGELDFYKSLRARVALLEGLEEEKVNEICNDLPMMPGANEVVTGLKERGYTVVCFSGGFRNATKPACERLGVNADFSNFLHAENGVLTGQVGGEMMYSNAKGDMITRMQGLLGVGREETLVVGDGANEVVTGLKERGYTVVCFSGGFRNATKPACERLGVNADFSNFLHAENGVLTGQVGGEMMYSNAKGDMITRMQGLLGVGREETLVVGDGANDLSMFAHADTRVAFCAKPVLKEAATHCVDEKDLTKILEIVDAL